MTTVVIHPGVCGFECKVTVNSEDGETVTLQAESGCPGVSKMFEELGDTFDSFDICFAKPGTGPLYEYAAEHFPPHCACPTIAGIVKAVEAECKLALPRDVSIHFESCQPKEE